MSSLLRGEESNFAGSECTPKSAPSKSNASGYKNDVETENNPDFRVSVVVSVPGKGKIHWLVRCSVGPSLVTVMLAVGQETTPAPAPKTEPTATAPANKASGNDTSPAVKAGADSAPTPVPSASGAAPPTSSEAKKPAAKSSDKAGADLKSQGPGEAAAKAPGETAPSKTIPFEYSPYKIHIWVVGAPSPGLTQDWLTQQQQDLLQRVNVIIGAPWSATVGSPPEKLYHTIAQSPELLSAAAVAEARKEILKDDKLIVVRVSASPLDYALWARELDLHTRTWGSVISRSERQPAAVSSALVNAVVAAFAPIARIEEGQGKSCVVRGRATGLVTEPDSPVQIGKGDVLQPIYRQNDRFGNPVPGKTEALPFTFLHVTSADPLSPHLFNCNVHSGMRSPIHGRSTATSRRERWAIKVRPRFSSTTLYVENKIVRRNDPKLALPGIEVFAKTPEPEVPREMAEEERAAAEKKNPPTLLGVTDWRGVLSLKPDGTPLRVIYLKNGGLLLARLPIVPGLDERLVAEIPDDNPRLQAEGFVRGMNSEVTDLVVQRQLIAVRMRKRIAERKLDEAEKLFEELRGLKTLNDLQQMLNVQLQRQKPTNSAAVKQKIEKLYGDERALLAKYIDAELPSKLLSELAAARANPAPPEAEEDPSAPPQDAAKSGADPKKLPAAVQSKGQTNAESK